MPSRSAEGVPSRNARRHGHRVGRGRFKGRGAGRPPIARDARGRRAAWGRSAQASLCLAFIFRERGHRREREALEIGAAANVGERTVRGTRAAGHPERPGARPALRPGNPRRMASMPSSSGKSRDKKRARPSSSSLKTKSAVNAMEAGALQHARRDAMRGTGRCRGISCPGRVAAPEAPHRTRTPSGTQARTDARSADRCVRDR